MEKSVKVISCKEIYSAFSLAFTCHATFSNRQH